MWPNKLGRANSPGPFRFAASLDPDVVGFVRRRLSGLSLTLIVRPLDAYGDFGASQLSGFIRGAPRVAGDCLRTQFRDRESIEHTDIVFRGVLAGLRYQDQRRNHYATDPAEVKLAHDSAASVEKLH
jgi:hypothetical protein